MHELVHALVGDAEDDSDVPQGQAVILIDLGDEADPEQRAPRTV
ncbi:hypothetical protein [Curtobacterium flaccumfaciens]|nr:hypothetical protein [Curtobacterium flaccumfaciens]